MQAQYTTTIDNSNQLAPIVKLHLYLEERFVHLTMKRVIECSDTATTCASIYNHKYREINS